ncbi:MAG: hypothetical protein OEX02_13205 [Cyclobacteriaceae bacterium]|nr:hypothetical protein [Cyclobacteriaceae bacterium]
MIRTVLIALIVFLFIGTTYSQDKFYLRNGSIIKGKYVGDFNNQFMRVKIDTTVIEIPFILFAGARYSRSTLREMQGKPRKLNQQFISHIDSGFFGRITLGRMMGNLDRVDVDKSYNIATLVGYRWNKYLNTALRLGFESFREYRVIPINVHYEYDLSLRKLAHFVYTDIGYGFVIKPNEQPLYGGYYGGYGFDEVRGGLNFGLGGGYRLNLKNNDLRLSLGYKTQKMKQKNNINEFEYGILERKRQYNRLEVNLGFSF